jgi:hypothetical protein
MATRLPASERTREGLTTLVEGRLSTASPKDELVKPLVGGAGRAKRPMRSDDLIGRPSASRARTSSSRGSRRVCMWRGTAAAVAIPRHQMQPVNCGA